MYGKKVRLRIVFILSVLTTIILSIYTILKLLEDEVVYFKPNTLLYAVPQGSDLAKEILQSNMGIVFHTEYVGGPTLADTTAKFVYDSSGLTKNKDVWFRDATIKDLSGTVTLTEQESVDMIKAITDANN